ncbi:MAG: patatin-like protein [bacterium]|nr:patatin-like protein [bacterium]
MDAIQKEIRFAVVMYGGVSLAIYMNGISQELLSLVQSTADGRAPTEGSTDEVYRELAGELGGGASVKFVIDILSGTSAGGINAVFLSKALVRGCSNLSSLENIWLDEGDIDKLLNDLQSEPRKYPSLEPKTSLLNSQRMYAKLLDAFHDMEAQSSRESIVQDLDLYVTATDLQGLYVPIRLVDGQVEERIHKHVFHFNFRKGTEANFFGPLYDPMLAFASRCTSSFPAAFEPMKLDDIREYLNNEEKENFDDCFEDYKKHFFRVFQAEADVRLKNRVFADGGYLDNRPFGHAIQCVNERGATCPVERKLMFIDPFPETGSPGDATEGEISFIQNLNLAAMSLPRYETIRGDIAEVKQRNRWIRRVKILMESVEDIIQDRLEGIQSKLDETGTNYTRIGLEELLPVYGDAYASYHYAKVYAVTDELALMVTRAAELEERSDLLRAVRWLVMAWRKDHYYSQLKKAEENRAATENMFLVTYDLSYRIRRLNHMRELVEQLLITGKTDPILPENRKLSQAEIDYLTKLHEVLQASLRSLHTLRYCLFSYGNDNPLAESVQAFAGAAGNVEQHLQEVLGESEDGQARQKAKKLYGSQKKTFQAIADEISNVIRYGREGIVGTDAVANDVSIALADASSENSAIADKLSFIYRHAYDLRDSLTFPLLAGGNFGEGSDIGIFRISPIDAASLWDRQTQSEKTKLAGVALGAFGGFLDRQWRQNDIMWGRLDGAERVISALLPGDGQQPQRQAYIDKAHRIILKESFTGWLPDLEKLKHTSKKARNRFNLVSELLDALGNAEWKDRFRNLYRVDTELEAATNLRRLGRSSRIFSSMFERLAPGKGVTRKFANLLKKIGSLLFGMVDLTLPKSWQELLVNYWLKLLLLFAVLLSAAGTFLKPFQSLAKPGYVLLGLVLFVWWFKHYLEVVIHNQTSPGLMRFLIKALVALAALGLLAILITFTASFGEFWNLFLAKFKALWFGWLESGS